MEYEDFELQIGPYSREGVAASVLRSPAGAGTEYVALPHPIPDPSLLLGPLRQSKRERQPVHSSPIEIGGELFRRVFTGRVGELFQQSLGRIETPKHGLRLRLKFNAHDPAVAPLLGLPWELLFRESPSEFLALNDLTPIVRALEVPRPIALPLYRPPLRILAILARDAKGSILDLEEELDQLRQALEPNSAIQMEVLEDPSTRGLRRALDRGGAHILHYMGHASFEPISGEGALLFGGPDGRRPVTGRHLAIKVQGLEALRLVVLNACKTAVSKGEAPESAFAGVATALVLGGVPAVVAMQSPIQDGHAIEFTSAFYERLALGMSVEEAITEGRQAIHSLSPETATWAIPVLFLRAEGDLFAQQPREEADGPKVSPPAPGKSGRPLGWSVLLILLAAAVGAGLWYGLSIQSGSRKAEDSVRIGAQPKSSAAKTDPVQRRPPALPAASPSKPASVPGGQPARGRTTQQCGLELVVVGAPPAGFVSSLCKETERLAGAGFAVAGRSARIEVGPARCSPAEAGGVFGTSCTIEVLLDLQGRGESRDLPSIAVEGWNSDEVRARSAAAAKLAPAVVSRIAASL